MNQSKENVPSVRGVECPQTPAMADCDSPLGSANRGDLETRVCFFCKKEIGPRRLEVKAKKKQRLLGVIDSTDDPVCCLCYKAVAPKRKLSAEDMELRSKLTNAAATTSSQLPLEAAIEGRARLYELDRKIKHAINMAQKHTKLRNQILPVVLEIEKTIAVKVAAKYEQRRKDANVVISKREVRVYIFSRDNWRCLQCKSKKSLTVDHIIPVVAGGTDELDNLQTLCRPCNCKKGGKTINLRFEQ